MNKFLTSNTTLFRLLRTIVQGIIGILIAYADVFTEGDLIPVEYKPIAVAVIIAILSPIMSELKQTELIDEATLKELEASYDEDRREVLNDED